MKDYRWHLFIAITFLCEGMFGLTFKLVGVLGLAGSTDAYVLAYNALALALTLPLLAAERFRLSRHGLACGAGIGLCLGASALFCVRAAIQLDAIVFYPLLVAGEMILVTILSRVFFHERLTPRQIAGVGVAVISIALLSAS